MTQRIIYAPQTIIRYPGLFGGGSDGDVVISSNTSLSQDMFYRNLTINAGVTLTTNNHIIYVSGVLLNNGTIDSSGSNASGINAGSSPWDGNTIGGGGGATGRSTPGVGASPGVACNDLADVYQFGGTGGTGGANAGGAGADSITQVTPTMTNFLNKPYQYGPQSNWSTGGQNLHISGGGGAGGMAASGTGSSGGGGGAGGLVLILANVYNGANGILKAIGGNGGNAAGTLAIGGGGGGSGGCVAVVATTIAPGTVNVAGGTGGTGANGGTNGANGPTGVSFISRLLA